MSDATAEHRPQPVRSFTHQGLDFHVYESPDAMGRASAIEVVARQLALLLKQPQVSIQIMAAPSAYSFYDAYADLAASTPVLREALAQTHFFQFDEYPLPASHPASFRFLLREHFFNKISEFCPDENIHYLNVDGPNPMDTCSEYTRSILEQGPDLQVKGLGENGHWGFHEPGIPLDAEPAFIEVPLSPENSQQQINDHPALFATADDVPKFAYTANVPLFMKTRRMIEDLIPQRRKTFALLAAYASDVVDSAVPSSALKQHPHATVRTTTESAWALEDFIEHGHVRTEVVDTMAADLAAPNMDIDPIKSGIIRVLNTMSIKISEE